MQTFIIDAIPESTRLTKVIPDGKLRPFAPCMIIVQARMLSTRLAGKILKPVLGKPLLYYLIERLRRVSHIQGICIATSVNPADDVIVEFCNQNAIHCIRGSEEDVLCRYYTAAQAFGVETVVRITSDCPLMDPEIIQKALYCFWEHSESIDYLSNTIERSFPRGMCVEIFRFEALRESFFNALQPFEREHVTQYIVRHPEKFRLASFVQRKNESQYRLTVDTQEDFELIKRLIEELYPKNCEFSLSDIVRTLKQHPELVKINAHVVQKEI